MPDGKKKIIRTITNLQLHKLQFYLSRYELLCYHQELMGQDKQEANQVSGNSSFKLKYLAKLKGRRLKLNLINIFLIFSTQ